MALTDLIKLPQRLRILQKHTSGSGRSPINYTMDGGLPTHWDWGWWQQNRKPLPLNTGMNATVEACIAALSQTTAMCPIYQMVDRDADGQVRKKGSNLERVLLNPNPYETRSLFIVNALRSMYGQGNAYIVAERNATNNITGLHLMNPNSTRAYYYPEDNSVWYFASTKTNQPFAQMTEEDRVFPARNVMHLRLYTTNDPLKGETPLSAALNAVSANNAITGHQNAFFNNMSRPSGTLSTDEALNKEQMNFLRNAWNEQSAEINSGRLPILSRGLKFTPLALNSQDSQLVEAYGLTVADISRAFRVPLVLINDMSGATFNNAEQTMQFFLASGLGFLLNHIELEIAKLFGLPFSETVQFDTDVLLRTNFAERMKGLKEAVLGGIYAPDEARLTIGRGKVEGGEEPRVQMQVVPLSAYEREAKLKENQAKVDAVNAQNQEPEDPPEDVDSPDDPPDDPNDADEPDNVEASLSEEEISQRLFIEYEKAMNSHAA